MQQPPTNSHDSSLTPKGTDQLEAGLGIGRLDQMGEPVTQFGVNGTGLPDDDDSARQVRGYLQGTLDKFDLLPEINPGDCLAHISRAIARYHRGDPGCENDYRAAFLLDPGLTTNETVRALEDEITDDVAYVLMNCRKRLKIDPHDLFARVRRGLTLLVLYQDADGYRDLQHVFVESPAWRPFLRLLVNELKLQRARILAQMFRSP